MNELQTILADTVTRLFTDRVTTAPRVGREGRSGPTELWQAVEEGGLTLPPIPEARGGGGRHLAGRVHRRGGGGPLRACRCPSRRPWSGAWLLAEAGSTCRSGRSPWRRCTRARG